MYKFKGLSIFEKVFELKGMLRVARYNARKHKYWREDWEFKWRHDCTLAEMVLVENGYRTSEYNDGMTCWTKNGLTIYTWYHNIDDGIRKVENGVLVE